MCFCKRQDETRLGGVWGGLYIYLYNHELLLALFVDLWGAIGGQASTLGLFQLAICSLFGGEGLGDVFRWSCPNWHDVHVLSLPIHPQEKKRKKKRKKGLHTWKALLSLKTRS